MEGLLVPISRRRTTKLILRIALKQLPRSQSRWRTLVIAQCMASSLARKRSVMNGLPRSRKPSTLATLALQSPWVGWFKYSPRRAQERVHAQLGDWLECRASGHVAGSAQQQQHGILHQLDRTRVLGGQDLSRTSDRLPLFINRSNHCNTFRLRRHLLSILRRSKPRSSSDTVSSMIFTPRFVVNLLSRSLSLSLSLN